MACLHSNKSCHARGPGGAGFTLVELLVVIAIVVLLMAILSPTLSRTKELTRRAVCSSNQRQVAMAGFAYAAVNKNWMPGMGLPRVNQDPNYMVAAMHGLWVGYIPDYTPQNAAPVLYCPSMSTALPREKCYPTWYPWGPEYRWGYAWYAAYFQADGSRAGNWAGRFPSVAQTSRGDSRSIVVGDVTRGIMGTSWGMISHARSGGLGPYALSYGGYPHYSAPPWVAGAAEADTILPEGVNNARLDGSVRWFSYPAGQMQIIVQSYFLAGDPIR